MKQQQQQQQQTKIQSEIKKKTEQLVKNIKDFKYIQRKFKETSIKLCNDLIDLHRIKNPDYTFCDLLREKDLEDYTEILESYVPYDISPRVNSLYIEGKLNQTDMFVLKHTDKEFQTISSQNKLVEKILSKEIESKELIKKSKHEIRELIGENTNELDEEQSLLLNCVYQIEATAKRINENKKDLLKCKYFHKQKVIDSFNHLKNAIQFGLGIEI